MGLQSKKREANNFLAKIKSLKLQDWIDEAAKLPGMEDALEGFFCGRTGRIHEPLKGELEGLYLTMGWHTNGNNPKVEYAYVS